MLTRKQKIQAIITAIYEELPVLKEFQTGCYFRIKQDDKYFKYKCVGINEGIVLTFDKFSNTCGFILPQYIDKIEPIGQNILFSHVMSWLIKENSKRGDYIDFSFETDLEQCRGFFRWYNKNNGHAILSADWYLEYDLLKQQSDYMIDYLYDFLTIKLKDIC